MHSSQTRIADEVSISYPSAFSRSKIQIISGIGRDSFVGCSENLCITEGEVRVSESGLLLLSGGIGGGKENNSCRSAELSHGH